MPKSRGRKKNKGGGSKNAGKRRTPSPLSSPGPVGPYPAPPVSKLVDIIMSGDDLVGEDDPLIAEMWASQMLGTFYKLPLPIHVLDEFEKSMEASLIEAIDQAKDEKQLRVLRALAAIALNPIGARAQARADELAEQGVPDPPWAQQIGKPEFVDAWMTEDPYGDQRGYFARFRYAGRDPHTVTTLYDVNLGGIVKDSFAGYTKGDLRSAPTREEMPRKDAETTAMASEVLSGIAIGDMYIDNDWTEDFRKTRALLNARMRLLVDDLPEVPPESDPLPEEARGTLVEEFMGSGHATGLDAEDSIAHHALSFRCDYCDGDPLRWSPIGVELFMMDFLPRKVSLDAVEIRNVPAVLKGWVRFALEKRGLEERWISETEAAIDRWARDFKKEATNPHNFGPAKAIGQAMMASGIDLTDQRSVDRWIEDFNNRPFEERDEFLRDR
ncbi:MAG: hypothetical protein LC808_08650 [Actinobacteria bacterium]|nr:hypothetical protein [Actinomycetota bacterium]